MLPEDLNQLFERYLKKLIQEVEAYKDESNLWVVAHQVTNSAGNLCLHLVGNINNFIGKELGGTDYIRKRELEFSNKNVPRNELIQMIEATRLVVKNTLNKLEERELENEYPVIIFDKPMSKGFFLVHLATHLAYHLGQINYQRRLLEAL